jgi:hypothetical protein
LWIAIALAAPTAAAAQPHDDPFDHPTLVIPFDYAGALGVGPDEVKGELVLTRNEEAKVVSRALVAALQDRESSLVDPKLPPGAVVPQNMTWSSDAAPISQEVIDAHNRATKDNPNLALPPRFYSVQYSGQYRLDHHELQFNISAQLFERGAATSPRKYKGGYSGNFFVDLLSDALKAKLVPQKANP